MAKKAKKEGFRKYRKSGPDLHGVRKETEHNRNLGIFNNPVFKKACELAGIEPTIRQASKYKMGKGQAFVFMNVAKNEVNNGQ